MLGDETDSGSVPSLETSGHLLRRVDIFGSGREERTEEEDGRKVR